jgi:hypothetical protein
MKAVFIGVNLKTNPNLPKQKEHPREWMLFKNLTSNLILYRKRRPAATSAGSIWVVKSKTARVQPVLEIDGHPNKV